MQWGHVPLPNSNNNYTIEDHVSGKGLEKLFYKKYKEKLVAKDIFLKSRRNSSKEKAFVKDFLDKLGLSLSVLINIVDPDAIVFGGGVSKEIESFEELKKITEKYLKNINNLKNSNLRTVFLKPKYGDASGVRGAARLGVSEK